MAKIQAMVEAIRNDERVGRFTMSIADECYSDQELGEYLEFIGVKSVKDAVWMARRYLGCPICDPDTRNCPHL